MTGYLIPDIKLTVNYLRPLQEKLAAVNFAYVYDTVRENVIYFPPPRREGVKEVYVKLLRYYSGSRSGEEVVKGIEKIGYPLATIDELLVLGKEHSRKDDLYCNVVALGSPAASPDGKLLVPYISGNRYQPYLDLLPLKSGWANHFSYLVLCK